MRKWILLAAFVVWLFASAMFVAGTVHATPCYYVNGVQRCTWNGQMPQEQNTPGTYGGWTTDPVQCSPATGQCATWEPGQ